MFAVRFLFQQFIISFGWNTLDHYFQRNSSNSVKKIIFFFFNEGLVSQGNLFIQQKSDEDQQINQVYKDKVIASENTLMSSLTSGEDWHINKCVIT